MKNSIIISSLVSLPLSISAALVYEPFEDSEPSLNGNTPGSGFQNTWNAGSGAAVTAGSLSYGPLSTSGNKLELEDSNSTSVKFNSDLANAGLLNDGSSLWFSYLVDVDGRSGTNDQTGFSFGTSSLSTGNNLSMTNSGSGIGVFLSRGSRLKAASWNSSLSSTGPNSGINSQGPAALIVGRIDWGNTAADDDMISIFLPGTDLALPALPHASHNAGTLNQALFDTLSISHKNNGGANLVDVYDEIRFGGSYIDIVSVPEPSSRLIFGLAAFGIMVSRRARRIR